MTMEQPEWRRYRVRSPWRSSPLVLMTTVLSILILLGVLNSFLTKQRDPVGCGMVWMRPIYAKYEGFNSEWTRFASKYGLYLYREGGINEDFQVKGIPVLYITGNAGSHKQARSIAAEAASYWANHVSHDPERQTKGLKDLDFYTADFNEDITAFHGQTMLDQAEYLNDAIAYILSLYHDPQNPRRESGQPDPASVIVIGHSMGGIVARTMLTLPNYQANSINTIITLSSPHARAPVSFDEDIIVTYKKINDYWRQSYSGANADNPLSEVTLISIAGGSLDTVVPSDYASLASLIPESNGFTVFTSTMPRVWTGCDHLSILWCDQLRKSIVRALFQITNVRESSQTVTRDERMRVFRKQFLTGMEDHIAKGVIEEASVASTSIPFAERDVLTPGERLIVRELGKTGAGKTYLLPIPTVNSLSSGKMFTLMSSQSPNEANIIRDLDVLACSIVPIQSKDSSTQEEPENESDHGNAKPTKLTCKAVTPNVVRLPTSSPSSTYPFTTIEPLSYLQFNCDEISEYQYIAVVDKAQSFNQNWIVAEFSDKANSEINYQVGLRKLLFSGVHLSLPIDRPMMINIKVPAVYSSLLAYKLQISAQPCPHGALFSPLARQYIQDPYESKYFVNVKEADISLHGLSPYMPPPLRSVARTNGLSLQIWSDPTCGGSLDISLDPDITGSLGKFVMRYRTIYPAIPLVIIALVLRKQFGVYDSSGVFITFLDSLNLCMQSSIPILLISVTAFSFLLAGFGSSRKLASPGSNTTEFTTDFSRNDTLLGSTDAVYWLLVPVAGILAIGACVLINYAALVLVHLLQSLSSVASFLAGKLQRNHYRQSPENVFSSLSLRRRVVMTLFLLILISTFVPYQFAYMVACIVQLITCTRALRASKELSSNPANNFYNYTHSIFVLMLWILPINLPVFVVWIHNLAVHWLTPFSSHHNILSIMPFVFLVESLSGGTMIPRVMTRSRHITNALFFVLAAYAGLYGVSFAYQLHDIANVIAAWLVIVQISSSDQLNKITIRGHSLPTGQHVKKQP